MLGVFYINLFFSSAQDNFAAPPDFATNVILMYLMSSSPIFVQFVLFRFVQEGNLYFLHFIFHKHPSVLNKYFLLFFRKLYKRTCTGNL